MPTNTGGGTTTSFMNTPQAVDDLYNVYEDCIWTFDVMSNDLGGNAKILWSIDDSTLDGTTGVALSADGTYDLLKQDAACVPEFSDLGARIWIDSGKIRYDASVFTYLGVGQSVTDHFTYAIRLSNGTLSWATVTVTVGGTNDGPDIRVGAGDTSSATINETNAGLCKTGMLTVTDPDTSDTISTSIALTSATGPTGGPSNAQLLNMLSVTPASGLAANTGDVNNLTWKFDSGSEAFNYLRAGQTLQIVYTLTVNDGHGGTDSQTVSITVTGTNDAPVLSDTTDPTAVLELGDASAQNLSPITGNFSVTDLDIGDTLDASVVGGATVLLNGNPFVLPAGATALTAAGAFTVTDTVSNGGAVNIGYSYDPSAANLDFLGEGESLTITYAIQVSDGTVTSGQQTVTITITGTNDAPVLNIADTSANVTEDVGVVAGQLNDSGALSFTDADVNDTVTISAAYNNNAVWSGGSLSPAQITAITGGFTADSNSWDYTVANAALDFLGAGESITLSFTVTATDDSGAGNNSDSEVVTLTITGTNDAPVLNIADTSANVTEDVGVVAGQLNDSGALSFTDADVNDTVTISAAYNNNAVWSGGSLSPAQITAITGGFTADSNSWDYTVANAALDFLGAGESITLSFTVTATDDSGAGNNSDSEVVTLTITGTNDAPVLTGDLAATINEGGTYQLTLADLNFTDPDDGAADVTFTATDLSNGTLFVNGIAQTTFTGAQLAAGLVTFTHNGSETLTAGFNISVEDGNEDASAPVSQPFNFSVTPVNDAPTNSVPAGQAVNEDQTLVFSNGNGNAISISDADAGSSTVQVTLNVASGTLTLGSLVGLTVTAGANGSSTVTVQGTQAAINAGLQGLTYQGNLNFNGGDSLSIVTSDLGNSGSGGTLTDSDSVAITVNPVNDAPVNSMPASFTTQEDVHLVLSGLSVSDVDAASGNVTVTLSVDSGVIFMGSSISVATTGNGTNSISITGTVAAVNAFLANPGVQPEYWPASNANGPVTLTMTTTDNGNTGLGGAQTDTDTRTINVTPVNDFPHLDNPIADQSFDEDTAWNWTVPTGTFSDIDGDTLTYTAELSDGNPLPAWLHFDGPTQTFSGTPPQDFNGSYIVRVIASDGSLTASDTFDLTVLAVNDAPVNTLPASYSTNENTALRLSGLSVADVDAGGGSISVTLSVGSGTIAASNAGGVTVSGSGTNAVTLNGTLAAINTYLATVANQPTFTPVANTNGSVTFAMSTGDNGNTGSGGALFDTDLGTINVVHVVAAPTDIIFTLAASTANLTGNGINTGMTLGSLSAVDADSSTWTFAIGSVAGQLLPAVTASPTSGSSVNLVTSGSVASGNYQFTVTATDAQGQSFTETYTLSVGTNGGDNSAFFTISAGTDISLGLNGQDAINGGAGDDALVGGQNTDTLNGGLGNDQLVGGAGGDNFLFNTTLNGTTNVDQILDFDASGGGNGDHIQLDDAIFAQLTPGALAAGNFASNPGGVAADGNDYVLYDSASGNLYYDADGNGSGQRILVAHITVVAGTIDPTDILIV